MSYEINVIVIEQSKPLYLDFKSEILLFNELEEKYFARYFEIWSFFSNTRGILYKLLLKESDDYYSSSGICDSDFNFELCENEVLRWLTVEEREELTPLLIKEKYWKDFIRILKYLLDNAPQDRIMFHTRYQGLETEVVCGVVKFGIFVDMLSKKQVLFNVCYIIEKD